MSRLINIMPMAGLGKRFSNLNYKNPKPLIKINNTPMFIEASKSMPKADLNIYICNENILNSKKVKDKLHKFGIKNYSIISTSENTNGQASTCLLAKDLIRDDDIIFIHSCDSFIQFDNIKFLKQIKKNDVIVFTTKPTESHLTNINSYGWVHFNIDKINKITCKIAASKNPENDHIIVGSFAFRNKYFFLKSINSIIENKIKINNEYYLDVAINEALKLNFKVQDILVDKYMNWGTPEELEQWK